MKTREKMYESSDIKPFQEIIFIPVQWKKQRDEILKTFFIYILSLLKAQYQNIKI